MAQKFSHENNQQNKEVDESRFFLLMSLALDDLLSDEEETEFVRLLEQSPHLANEWQVWRELDAQFVAAPAVNPPADFAQKVAASLNQAQSQQQLRLGVMIGGITVFFWLLLMVALLSTGAYLAVTQNEWLGGQIHSLAAFASTVSIWWSALWQTLSQGFELSLTYPQLWGAAIIYMVATGSILLVWTRLLRRSLGRMITA